MVTATRSPDPRSNVKVRPCPRTYRNRLRPRIANASSTQCGQGRGWGARLMANPNHLDLLREGVEGLCAWRAKEPFSPDCRFPDLSFATSGRPTSAWRTSVGQT